LAKKTATQNDIDIDMSLIKALAHPWRYRALHILNKRVASPKEVAEDIGVPTNNIAYHFRELEKLNCIELVRTQPRRGATEHFYRAITRAYFSDADWVKIPKNLKDNIVVAHMNAIGKEISAALADGTFNARDDRWQSWLPMLVDEQAWKEVMEVLADTYERLLTIQAENDQRRAESGQEGFTMAISLMGFETTRGA
jgi:predicted ArsR family transcriptional regulator